MATLKNIENAIVQKFAEYVGSTVVNRRARILLDLAEQSLSQGWTETQINKALERAVTRYLAQRNNHQLQPNSLETLVSQMRRAVLPWVCPVVPQLHDLSETAWKSERGLPKDQRAVQQRYLRQYWLFCWLLGEMVEGRLHNLASVQRQARDNPKPDDKVAAVLAALDAFAQDAKSDPDAALQALHRIEAHIAKIRSDLDLAVALEIVLGA